LTLGQLQDRCRQSRVVLMDGPNSVMLRFPYSVLEFLREVPVEKIVQRLG